MWIGRGVGPTRQRLERQTSRRRSLRDYMKVTAAFIITGILRFASFLPGNLLLVHWNLCSLEHLSILVTDIRRATDFCCGYSLVRLSNCRGIYGGKRERTLSLWFSLLYTTSTWGGMIAVERNFQISRNLAVDSGMVNEFLYYILWDIFVVICGS